MANSIRKEIKEFIYDRIYKIHKEILPRDREYRELGKKPAEILQHLFDNLTSEEKEKWNNYDEAQILQMNRQDELVYSRGLVDGILFGYWIDRARQEPGKFLSELGFKDQQS